MRLFYTTAPLDLCFDEQVHGPGPLAYRTGLACQLRAATPRAHFVPLRPIENGRLTVDTLFVALTAEFFDRLRDVVRASDRMDAVRVLRSTTAAGILSRPGMPHRLQQRGPGESSALPAAEQLAALSMPSAPRIAIINRYATAFGDAIVSATAFRALRHELIQRFPNIVLDLVQHPDNIEAERLLLSSHAIDAIRHLPMSIAELAAYDAYFDLTLDHDRPDLCWIDTMLEALAVDHLRVPAERKQNALTVPVNARARIESMLAPYRAQDRPLVLLHPEASTAIRTIPPDIAGIIADALVERTGCTILTTARVGVDRAHVISLSGRTPGFDDLVALVASVDAFVCADTCVYHIANAFEVPGVVLFTSVEPERRLRYYRNMGGILVGDDRSPLIGRHFSDSAEDFGLARSLWSALDVHDVADMLATRLAVPMHQPVE